MTIQERETIISRYNRIDEWEQRQGKQYFPTENGKELYAKCKCCNDVALPVRFMEKADAAGKGGALSVYVCPRCAIIHSYGTNNDSGVFKGTGKARKIPTTVSFELECDLMTARSLATITAYSDYTIEYDSSLDVPHPAEVKMKGYRRNMSGVKEELKVWEKYIDLSDESCGQHINIGLDDGRLANYINTIRTYSHQIFNPLARAVADDAEDNFFGRTFTYYANWNEYGHNYNQHKSFINLQHDNRIEFRLSKYHTATQYTHLVIMCREMVEAIMLHMFWSCKETSWEHRAQVTGKKLVSIYRKYMSRKAQCQQAQYNKYGLDY